MMKLDLVDVFGATAMTGNPLAVVHGGQGLSDGQMLHLTQWLGFSETTFLLPPTDPAADYAVRIFYPAGELPFAGHPTLGSCFAWAAAGGVAKNPGTIVQQCGAGLVPVRQDGDRLAFAAPPFTRYGPMDDAEMVETARLAGIAPEQVVEAVHVANGPQWRLLRLGSAAEVLAARPMAEAPIGTDIGLAAPAAGDAGVDWELRAFFADHHGRMVEDPVTGSFNAGVAMHLFGTGQAGNGSTGGSFIAGQGQVTGADGRVHCTQDDAGQVWIGGRCAMVAAGGTLSL